MSAGGGRVGNTYESDQSLLSFSGSKFSHHLRHINAERVEAMEGLLALLLTEGRDLGQGWWGRRGWKV